MLRAQRSSGCLQARGPVRRRSRAPGRLLVSALGVAFSLLWVTPGLVRAEPLAGGTLSPDSIPKFADPLVIPPVMPAKGLRWDPSVRKLVPYYEIELVQFQQQILPSRTTHGRRIPPTTVWSYGAVGHPETRNYPAFTVENLSGVPTRVKWVNGLVDAKGRYLPHLLPVDQTLHWANPGQLPCMDGTAHTDCRPAMPMDDNAAEALQQPYAGPVPMVTHVHGAHVQPDSDGYPEAWWLPAATNIPSGYAPRGRLFDQITGVPREAGAAVFQYRNDQPPATLWYHDHTLGMTRTNVYAGPAGFWLVRDLREVALRLPGPAPLPGLDPNGNPLVRRLTHEIPLAIQDRSFNADGSLFYPDNRDFFEGLVKGSLESLGLHFTPTNGSDIAPVWNPEFFGNTLVVNGKTWPKLEVEPKRYRFRILNGSDSRFLILRFEREQLAFTQVGGDQGFLPTPVELRRLLIAPAERADVVVDFSRLRPGTRVVLQNVGPDEPFGGGEPCVDGQEPGHGCDFEPADPGSTGTVMAFDVVRGFFPDLSRVPSRLPVESPLPASSVVRKVSLNEEMSMNQVACYDEEGSIVIANATCPPGTEREAFGPSAALLGTLRPDGTGEPMMWSMPVTENPALGATETWEIYNFTADAHPIHLHLVRFEVLGREALVMDEHEGMAMQPARLMGVSRPPEPWERGFKDTVIAYPGEVTRIRARFDLPGLYVWHCHILEHEDNEMMRPYCVGGQETCPIPIAGQ